MSRQAIISIVTSTTLWLMFSISTTANEPRQATEPTAELTPAQLDQIIELRKKIGSSLHGSFLDKEPTESALEFRRALYEYSQQQDSNQAVQPAFFEQPAIPGADPLVRALRHVGLLLEERSNQLESSKYIEDARTMRRLAKRLRKQVHAIETKPRINPNGHQ